jgi:hypothetical protein
LVCALRNELGVRAVVGLSLSQYDDPARFLAAAREFLEVNEAENNLILGISSWFATHPERIQRRPYFAVVEEHGRVVGAAMMTPPFRLVLTRGERGILERVADDLLGRKIGLPGVNGPKETSRAFAELWAKKKGCMYELHRSMRIYQLSNIIFSRPVNGRMRLSLSSETGALADYAADFNTDIGEPQTMQQATATVEQLTKDRRLYVWDDGGIRSVTAVGGPTAHGMRISLVYTPPEFRGKGYASALVVAVSQAMLDSGKKFCFLFADLTNPVSNRIYQRIGFVPVCDFAEYEFK